MSFDSGARPPRANRRPVLLLSALAAIVLAGVGGVTFFSGDSWRDEAMSSGVFPTLPGDEFSTTPTDEPWWTTAGDPPTSGAGPSSGVATATVLPVTASPPSATSTTSAVPTTTAPQPGPSTTRAPSTPPSTGTPSPSSTSDPRPDPRPTKTRPPSPTPTSSPTSSGPGCWLLVIC